MMVLSVKGTEYKVKFGYNSFCDTDLLDRTNDLLKMLNGNGTDDKDILGIGLIKELFTCVRDLLYVGFEKINPVESKQEIGNILDDYNDEATEDNKRGIVDLFTKLTDELTNEGFLADLMAQMAESTTQVQEEPQTKTAKSKK